MTIDDGIPAERTLERIAAQKRKNAARKGVNSAGRWAKIANLSARENCFYEKSMGKETGSFSRIALAGSKVLAAGVLNTNANDETQAKTIFRFNFKKKIESLGYQVTGKRSSLLFWWHQRSGPAL